MKKCVAIFASSSPLLPIQQAGVCLLPQPAAFPAMPHYFNYVPSGPSHSHPAVNISITHITIFEETTSLITT